MPGQPRRQSLGLRIGAAWPFYLDRIADQLGIGVHQLAVFLHLSAYLFQTVFPSLFAYLHPIASYRQPFRVSAGCRESS